MHRARRHGFHHRAFAGNGEELGCHAIARLTLGSLAWNVTVETFCCLVHVAAWKAAVTIEACNPDGSYLDNLQSRSQTVRFIESLQV